MFARLAGSEDQVPSPQLTGLVEITPDPFNPQTKITCDLAHDLCRARIRQQHPDWTDAEVVQVLI